MQAASGLATSRQMPAGEAEMGCTSTHKYCINTFHPGPAGEEAVFSDQNSSFPYLPDYLGSARKHQTFG
jgi:hypothetical protein